MTRRFMVLSAGMGAGHDAVAGELARRLGAQGHQVLVHDVLTLLPAGAGRALRSSYRFAVRHAPFLYAGVHALFLAPGGDDGRAGDGTPGGRPGRSRLLDVSPLPALAEGRLSALVREWRPDAVVSTFHLAAQITGRMRGRGTLPVPSAVFVTDFALHRGWFHPDNDLYLCVTESCAEAVRSATGARTAVPGPVVPPEFGRPPDTGTPDPGTPGRPEVLICTGAWGVGSGLIRTAQALAGHGCLPVLLCGRDERLRRRAGAVPGTIALGWVDDLPRRMASARLLVDNAAGQTAVQALAAGLPVVGYRPLAGHGATGVRAMAAEGLTASASSLGELLWRADELLAPGPVREAQLARAAALFRDDAARFVAELAAA
ncbi:MGDG synthase family glycosyltransferase [Streptomyces peucetius]|uniref:Galactosyldiacylglycerol synthase n=1 Tax=Streptomyces peucetius TaxID=1950 RepID=A0ABY6I062_STRPE|nr:galactosyldiacylglycerol synthase [Streptomyces peucetius]UYQ60363.1 galactosyldiacylglycerol synthase [Streptomyces peucetius]